MFPPLPGAAPLLLYFTAAILIRAAVAFAFLQCPCDLLSLSVGAGPDSGLKPAGA
jgi:hypothetical protein